MSLHTKPVVPATPPPNPLSRGMTVVVVTRSAIGRDGWPQSWKELVKRAESDDARDRHFGGSAAGPDYVVRQMTLGELVSAAYTPSLQQAFFREGSGDLSCLVAQAWMA